MQDTQKTRIIVDASWTGSHGIGRFSAEVVSRLGDVEKINIGKNPLCLMNFLTLPLKLRAKKNGVFFTPGFNPPIYSPIPFVFVLHDLTHIKVPKSIGFLKKLYYKTVVKFAAKKAFKILTVSEFSKKDILNWLSIPQEKVVVVKNGVSENFFTNKTIYNPGFPYVFCLGNFKPHKNIFHVIQAFSRAKIDANLKLLVAGHATPEINKLVKSLAIEDSIIFAGSIREEELSSYYRGAKAFIFASLYEGFGLPILEAMASEIPVLTSNATSMPEVADDAALLVDPYDVNSIAIGIEKIIKDEVLRQELRVKGLRRAREFTWEKTAQIIKKILEEAPQK